VDVNLKPNLFTFAEPLNLCLRELELELPVLCGLNAHGALALVDRNDPSFDLLLRQCLWLLLPLLRLALLRLALLRLLLLLLSRLRQRHTCRRENRSRKHPEQCCLVHGAVSSDDPKRAARANQPHLRRSMDIRPFRLATRVPWRIETERGRLLPHEFDWLRAEGTPSRRFFGPSPKVLFEHLGLRTAFGVLRPKPQFEHLGLRTAFGVLRPNPNILHVRLFLR